MALSPYLAQLDRATVPPPAPRSFEWPVDVTLAAMLSLVLGLRKELAPRVEGDGDMCHQAVSLLDSFAVALRGHEQHARRWLALHGYELRGLIVLLLPDLFAQARPASSPARDEEKVYEGRELVSLALHVFPGSFRGPVQAKGKDMSVHEVEED